MCGIVGAIANRDVSPVLLEGLRRLEYRGYDSAGMAVLTNGSIDRVRRTGKVSELSAALDQTALIGQLGIAHTRWATHGIPAENNAHPHICNDRVAIVHNGIIENFEELRAQQVKQGFSFTSETDTEVIAHQIVHYLDQDISLYEAVSKTIKDLKGAYALGVIDKNDPDKLIAARNGSPLVLGIGKKGNFIASDVQALLKETQEFIFLENGDIAEITRDAIKILDHTGVSVQRESKVSKLSADAVEKGGYPHYMLKEIFEQPQAISDTLEGRLINGRVAEQILGPKAKEILDQTKIIQIIACGTSYHSGLIAKFWFEELAGIPCFIDVASEFRYRKHVVQPGTLFVTISQSGETADTLAALQQSKEEEYAGSLVICNVPESSLVRESDLALMTHAGPEIGVASTKAFTTQLIALLLLVITTGRRHGMHDEMEKILVEQLTNLPTRINKVLELDGKIKKLAKHYGDKQNALFLGRGSHHPVAMEGALKLKEISYIHAEAYPAGELKHGPIALVDDKMPIIAVAPNDELLEKLKSNLEEVRARGGVLHVFADASSGFVSEPDTIVIEVDAPDNAVAPILFTIPLQLLAYHVAILKGTDVDQPRNLAKSVTVE
ncbi:MAG: glutamine--fructose-6-phosphate transaminase (isomerizing) [Gammaproteobacteria bacterium]|nr:MAG: glutamine--fructose-6-phosphate transaminase (isomerizing) [Gammaproteobacteria bacterium]